MTYLDRGFPLKTMYLAVLFPTCLQAVAACRVQPKRAGVKNETNRSHHNNIICYIPFDTIAV